MTLSTATNRVDYTGDNSTDTYAYTFRIFANTDLEVTQTDTGGTESTLTLTTDYTVTGVGDDAGGNVVLVAGNLTTGYTLTIKRVRPLTQTTDIRNQGSFLPETHEDAFDHNIMVSQQQQDELDQSVKLAVSETSSDFDPVFPTGVAGTANASPVTNAAGDGWAAVTAWPTASAISSAETYATQAAASAAAAAVEAGTLAPYGINNMALSASVASSALTITMTQADGTALSTGTSSATIYFRSATLATGTSTARSITAPLSIVIPSGATLGHNDAVADDIFVYAMDNAGTVELAVSSSTHFNESNRISPTAITTGADDANTIYATGARSNLPFRLIGRCRSTQTTAGTWDAAPSTVHPGWLFNKKNLGKPRAIDFNAKHNDTYWVDTSSARAITLPTAKNGVFFTVKDKTGTCDANNITITRAASESIENVAANYVCDVPYGSWTFECDGTDWWLTSDKGPARSFAQFKLTGTQTVPGSSAYGDVTYASTVVASGGISRSTNDISFKKLGWYKLTLQGNDVSADSSSVGTTILLQFWNQTDSAAVFADTSAIDLNTISTTEAETYNPAYSYYFEITDTADAYRMRWATVNATTATWENGYLFIEYMGS